MHHLCYQVLAQSTLFHRNIVLLFEQISDPRSDFLFLVGELGAGGESMVFRAYDSSECKRIRHALLRLGRREGKGKKLNDEEGKELNMGMISSEDLPGALFGRFVCPWLLPEGGQETHSSKKNEIKGQETVDLEKNTEMMMGKEAKKRGGLRLGTG